MLQKKRRYLTALSLILLAGMLFIALVSYSISKNSIRAQLVDSTLPLIGNNIYSEIQRDLLRPVFIASLMASNTFVHDWATDGERDVARMSNYLKAIKTEYDAFTAFFVSESTRNYYHADGILKLVSEQEPRDEWYFNVKATDDDYQINTDPDMANNDELAVFVNYRVTDKAGRFIGAIGVGLAITSLVDLLNEYSESYSRIVYFLDEAGNIQLDNKHFGAATNIHDVDGLSFIAPQILNQSVESALDYTSEYGRAYLNSRYIHELGWYLVIEQRECQWMTSLSNALISNLLVSFLMAVAVIFLAYRVLFAYQDGLEKVAMYDKLTGVLNRQAFESFAEERFRFSARRSDAVSLLLIDVDHFKTINDGYGHAVGDQALIQIAKSIKTGLRASDTVCRWGGEEFCVLLTNTDVANAAAVAEQVRRSIEATPLVVDANKQLPITASIGVAQLDSHDDLHELMRNADDALYLAKRQGRNQVVVSAKPTTVAA